MIQKKNLIFLVVIDDSEEMEVALYYASRCSKRTGGQLGLFYAIEPTTFEHWQKVEEKIHEERRKNAEDVLSRYAEEIQKSTGTLPIFYIREGDRREQLVRLINSDTSISALVLAIGKYTDGPGPLISYLTGQGVSKLRIPLIVVPGDMSTQQIDDLT